MKILQYEPGKPSEDIVKLLTNNVIGTPGQSLVYEHQKTQEKLDFMENPAFLTLRLGGKAVGTACLISREVQVAGKKIKACYTRYFSFRNALRSKSDPIKRLNKSSVIKDEVKQFLSRHLESHDLIYAYVDPGNIRSKRIIEDFGFEEVGRFNTVFFSRFWPKEHQNIEQVNTPSQLSIVKQLIDKSYQSEGLFFDDFIGYQQSTFVYRNEHGEIIAGLQANAEHWKVHEIPGNKHLIDIISHIPLLNSIFNQDFRFVSLEGMFFKTGHKAVIADLITHALAFHKRHTAIACVDPRSSLYQVLKGINGGFIKNLTKEKTMAVVARGSEEVLMQLRKYPVYVSGFDNM